MNTYLKDALSDPIKDKEQDPLEAVFSPNQPTTEFDLEESCWKKVNIFTQPLRSGRIWHKVNF